MRRKWRVCPRDVPSKMRLPLCYGIKEYARAGNRSARWCQDFPIWFLGEPYSCRDAVEVNFSHLSFAQGKSPLTGFNWYHGGVDRSIVHAFGCSGV